MKRIETLKSYLPQTPMLISDTKMIEYFTGNAYEVGERLILLLVRPDATPLLFLNNLFTKPHNIETLGFADGDPILDTVMSYINGTTVYVDGSLQARFLIPLLPSFSVLDGSAYLDKCRRIKDEAEQQLMINASLANDEAMQKVIDYLEEGISEIAVSNYVRALQSSGKMSGPSFEPIVLFGENAADPHGIPSERTLRKGDMVLIDMGGMVEGYASDMTRSVFFGENDAVQKLHDIVLQANLAAIAKVGVGVPLSEVDKAARDVITNAGYGPQFVHRTGHGIGMETHENLDVSSANDTLIENGMCFSIEPGIYLPGFAGVRIEDLVLVKDGKALVLNHFPKDAINILQ